MEKPRTVAFNVRIENLPRALNAMNCHHRDAVFASRVCQVLTAKDNRMAMVLVEMTGYYPFITNHWAEFIENEV